MRRLVRFFFLLTLRVLTVVTVIAWGAGQVASFDIVLPFVGRGVGFATLCEGWLVGFIHQWSRGLRYSLDGKVTPLREAFHGKGGLLGGHLWVASNDAVMVGVSYPLTLFLLFATYAAFWLFTRRRRQSLQNKLADAAKLR